MTVCHLEIADIATHQGEEVGSLGTLGESRDPCPANQGAGAEEQSLALRYMFLRLSFEVLIL
jgi:hypothetical protein